MLELDRGLAHGDEVVVEITDVTDRGMGKAILEAVVGSQRKEMTYEIFVRKAIPGDTVRVLIERTRRKRCSGGWIEMIEPSVMRIEPKCPHFGRREEKDKGCGGCTFQSVTYRHQLAIKERMIKDRFKEAGVDTGLVLPVKGMEDPWNYRNKMEFSFGDDADREFALGLFPTGYKYEILNLETCYLQSEFVSRFIPLVRDWASEQQLIPYLNSDGSGFLRTLTIREGKRTGELMVELTTTEASKTSMLGEEVDADEVIRQFQQFALSTATELGTPITSLYWTRMRQQKGSPTAWFENHLHGKEVLGEELHLPGERALHFDIHPRAFFQPNTLGAEILYREVIEKAGLTPGTSLGTVLDLYCGTGTIGLCMAPFAEKVLGIEMQKDAVDNARKNAVTNEIDNIEFFAGDVGSVLGSHEFQRASREKIDLVIVDPPRSGLFAEAIKNILEIRAPTLVYVSCNPATMAKNLVDLIDGGYELEVVQPVDLFPHTFHVENVGKLVRR